MQADANDYIEKEFGAFFRSYPAQGGDALAYQRDGFLWNAAQNAGSTAADFGEYANFFDVPDTGAPTWSDWYRDSQILEGKASGPLPVPIDRYQTYADIPSLNAIIDKTYPRFDLNVPDQYRVDIWEKAFRHSQHTGQLANLNMLWVPDDHTSGLNSGDPYPTAQVADNDLAVGRIVDDISHSRFWKSSAIFVLEDDPQDGVDHVDSQYFTQLNVVKTIEQILAIPPMNQEDRAAEPIFSAFTDHADLRPYDALPNEVPLTLGVTTPTATRAAAAASRPAIPKAAGRLVRQWAAWSTHQHFTGRHASEDKANPAQLNRLDWYAATGWTRPYPGDGSVLAPNRVPGRNRPAAELGDG
jgi:hypothetical protein